MFSKRLFYSCHKSVNKIDNKKVTNPVPVRDTAKSSYVYIGKDIEDARSLYKIGRTINLNNRLRQYKTGQPNFEYIIKIKTVDSKSLELRLKNEFKKYAYHNEVFKNININYVKKLLRKWGYYANADQIYCFNL